MIRDVFGNEHYVATPFYASADAPFDPGYEEYTYSVGALRSGVGSSSWDYGRPVAFANHRRGMDEHFTLGGRAEASYERVSAGPSLTAIAGIGQFDLDLGASYDVDGLPGQRLPARLLVLESFRRRQLRRADELEPLLDRRARA